MPNEYHTETAAIERTGVRSRVGDSHLGHVAHRFGTGGGRRHPGITEV